MDHVCEASSRLSAKEAEFIALLRRHPELWPQVKEILSAKKYHSNPGGQNKKDRRRIFSNASAVFLTGAPPGTRTLGPLIKRHFGAFRRA